jgi:exodeoxyribonuclease V gamma subunit
MLRVVHGNRLDALAASLADALPAAGDPFARPTIVVSGALVARWLTFAIATRRGVAANLHLPFLEAFVAETWTGDAVGREARLAAMNQRRLAALVASVLADDAVIAGDAMAPVREYLHDDDANAAQVRRVQLAREVAALVWEYALTRPEWLDAWERGDLRGPEGTDAETWAWQARLVHAAAAARDRIFERGGPRWVAAPRLPRVRRALGLPAPRTAPVHVIGFSFLAPAYLDALGELADHTDVVVWAQDPCAELWEDVPGRRAVPAADEPRALAAWGRPARDYVGRLVELSNGDVGEQLVEPARDTALDLLRADILRRRGATGTARDAAVTVLACPSVVRELEIVGSEIRRLLDAHPDLRANQIAVYAAGPDADRYLAQLAAVWRPLALDHHVVDAPLAEHGRVAEAALLLLELPLGKFARPALLRLMTHPAVLARHRHVDPEDWVEWAERLGVVHGADARDHAGTYLADLGEVFHWEQGIRRLALGAFMDAPRGADGAPAAVRFAGKDYLPEPIAADQQASAATFALLARSLLADAMWLRDQRAPLARWAELLDAMAASYLGARDEIAARELVVVRGALAKLADLDLDGRELGYAEVVEIARRTIGGLRGDRGIVLADGVLVAPLAPGRALPARFTFVVGAGEGQLPDTRPRSPLDLRGAHVRRGDVSRGDRDRYAFLECVLAPEDALYVSFVARDLETGDPRQPSSLVLELGEMLGAYLGDRALERITIEHPLHRWDPSYDRASDRASRAPSRVRERHAVRVREQLTAALSARGVAVPEPRVLAHLLGSLPQLRAALRLAPAAELTRAPARAPAELTSISLSALRRFLETPAQAWAQVVLRLGEQEVEDPVDREDEPFATPAHERAVYLRDAFARHLGASGEPPMSVEDALGAVARARALAGHAPVGVFGEVELALHRDLLRRWSAELAKRGGAPRWRRHAFGKSAGAGCEPHAAIVLDVTIDGRARQVELVGWTELVGGAIGSLVLQPGKASERHALRGAFDAAVLAATGVAHAHAHLILDGEGAAIAAHHKAWAEGDARAWLRAVVEDLLGEPHAYLLSLKQVAAILEGKPPPADKAGPGYVGALGYGPLRRADDLTLPILAAAIVARRHKPIYDRITEGSP